jgi:hypothetical protein
MNTKLSTSMLRVFLGLSTLIALAGQSSAATLNDSIERIQSAPVTVNFGSGFFAQQPWSCGDCKYYIPEQPHYGNFLPSFSPDNRYGIPEKPDYGNFSPIILASIFESGNRVDTQNSAKGNSSHIVQEFQQQWGDSFMKPRTVFKGKDGWADNRWANHDHDEELNSGLSDWDDGSPISPVPEASEWALMLAGFGLIGFFANRRKRNDGYFAA